MSEELIRLVLEDVRLKKKNAEDAITKTITDFHKATGAIIDAVEISKMDVSRYAYDEKEYVVDCYLKVTL